MFRRLRPGARLSVSGSPNGGEGSRRIAPVGRGREPGAPSGPRRRGVGYEPPGPVGLLMDLSCTLFRGDALYWYRRRTLTGLLAATGRGHARPWRFVLTAGRGFVRRSMLVWRLRNTYDFTRGAHR
jgi:hypothetical protein